MSLWLNYGLQVLARELLAELVELHAVVELCALVDGVRHALIKGVILRTSSSRSKPAGRFAMSAARSPWKAATQSARAGRSMCMPPAYDLTHGCSVVKPAVHGPWRAGASDPR